jgi:Tfp pilus assembly protein PilF
MCNWGLLARSFLIFFLLLFTTFSASPQIPGGFALQVNGMVRYTSTRRPAENVLVRIESFSGGLVGQVTTDRSGKFSFSGLQPIQYVVSIHTPGYQDDRRNVNLATSNSEYLNFDLTSSGSYEIEAKTSGPALGGVVDARIPVEAQDEYQKAAILLDDKKGVRSAEAKEHLEKAVKFYPQYLEAHIMLGLTYMNLKDWTNAERSLKTALTINKEASTAYFALGEMYLRQKKYTSAQEILNTGLKLKEDSATGHLTLARVYWESAPESPDEQKFRSTAQNAWREVSRALQIDPKFPEAHLFAGNLLLRARRPADALSHYEQYISLAPDGEFAALTNETITKIRSSLVKK